METAVAFTAVRVPQGPAAEFMRRAVLEPLVGPVEGARRIVEQTNLVGEAWRDRVALLDAAGLPEFAGDRKRAVLARARALNCRPAFVEVEPRTRGCGFHDVCPFCWARRAAVFWEPIDRAFRVGQEGLRLRRASRSAKAAAEGPGRGGVPSRTHEVWVEEARARVAGSPGHDLVEWSRAVDVPFRIEYPRPGVYCDTLPLLIDKMVRGLRRAWRSAAIKAANGSFEALGLTVEGDRWRAELRRLIMVPAGSGTPEGLLPALEGGETTVHPRPTREGVMAAVVRACRFPPALLTGRNVRLVAYLIGCRRGAGLRATTGDFSLHAGSPRD